MLVCVLYEMQISNLHAMSYEIVQIPVHFIFIYKYVVIMMNIHQYIQTDTVEDVKFNENQLNWK